MSRVVVKHNTNIKSHIFPFLLKLDVRCIFFYFEDILKSNDILYVVMSGFVFSTD